MYSLRSVVQQPVVDGKFFSSLVIERAMDMEHKSIKRVVFNCIAASLAFVFTACDTSPSAQVKAIGSGEAWVVAETTHLSELTIARGAVLKAVDGHSLTMTVNGIETGMAAGTYAGDVILTPTEDILVEYKDMGLDDKYFFRTAVYVKDGALVPEKSVRPQWRKER
jgi:uncharacterized lipoprotein YehR (DUF1307 family)